MNAVQIDQKSYEMPPREGISIAQFLTVADIERSARYYEEIMGLMNVLPHTRSGARLRQWPPKRKS